MCTCTDLYLLVYIHTHTQFTVYVIQFAFTHVFSCYLPQCIQCTCTLVSTCTNYSVAHMDMYSVFNYICTCTCTCTLVIAGVFLPTLDLFIHADIISAACTAHDQVLHCSVQLSCMESTPASGEEAGI